MKFSFVWVKDNLDAVGVFTPNQLVWPPEVSENDEIYPNVFLDSEC